MNRPTPIRLSADARQVIQDTVVELFGPEAGVAVFGSRADPTARGGDIDLLVRLPSPVPERERKALELVARLQMRLGDQPIDVLVIDPQTPLAPIHRQALATGVFL